jgi:mannose-6-phosphate isomerase-like protein (cupin superfamily)
VGARFAEIQRTSASMSDISETYFYSDSASVHMHVMGFEQTCPLHIHRKTAEATVVVAGQAEVTQIHGRDKSLRTVHGTYGPGTVVVSPPFCGHEFRNRDPRMMLGNLVIAAPPFDGNFYLGREDPRMHQGGAPYHYRPEDDLAAFGRGDEPARLVVLPVLDGLLSSLLVRRDFSLDSTGDPTRPTLLYVTSGEGHLDIGGRRLGLRPRNLVTVRSAGRVVVRAAPNQVVAILVIRPETRPAPSPAPNARP